MADQDQNNPAATLPSYSVSQIAQTYHFNCDKLLRLTGQPKSTGASNTGASSTEASSTKANSTRASSTGTSSTETSSTGTSRTGTSSAGTSSTTVTPSKNSLADAHKARGERFEAVLKDSFRLLVDCTDIPAAEARNMLQQAQVGQTLYQLRCQVPQKFYTELGVEQSYKLRTFMPDFITIKADEDGGVKKVLFITDAKSSRATNVSHQVKFLIQTITLRPPQFQVATYAFLLGFITRDMRNIVIESLGGIYLPSSPSTPKTFRLDFLLPRIESFFRTQLPVVLAQSQPRWLYNTKCRGCEYVDKCRQEAYDTIGMVPYLSEAKVKGLEGVDTGEYRAGGRGGARQGEEIIQVSEDDDEEPISGGISDAYSPGTVRIRFIGRATASFPAETDHDLIITMSLDPLYTQPFGYAIALNKGSERIYSHAYNVPKDFMAPILAFTDLMREFVTALNSAFTQLATAQSRACLFVLTDADLQLMRDSLLRYVALDVAQPQLTSYAMRCLLSMFEDTQLLTTNLALPDLTSIPEQQHLRSFPRVVVIENAVKDNIALGVPGFYRLEDLFVWMVEPMLVSSNASLASNQLGDLRRALPHVDSGQIHERWISSPPRSSIDSLHSSRVSIASHILSAFRSLASRYCVSAGISLSTIFLFSPPPFAFPKTREFRSSYLSKLYFFKQYEAVTACDQIRHERFRGIGGDEGEDLGGVLMMFEGYDSIESPVLKKKSMVGKFKLVDGTRSPYVLEPTGMNDYILVEDSVEGALEAIHFPDILYCRTLRDLPATSVNIHSIDSERSTLILKGYFKRLHPIRDKPYRLYARYIDFNLDKVLIALAEIDERAGESLFLWGTELLGDATDQLRATALKLRDEFGMSPSQKEITAEVIKKRMQIIWGPPVRIVSISTVSFVLVPIDLAHLLPQGSGKTHFLALFLVWYLTHLRPSQPNNARPLFIGLTAYTRAAIGNLLDRVALVKESHPAAVFEIIKLVTETSGSSWQRGMTVCKAKDLKKKLKNEAVVVGGTVWDWYKVKQEWEEWEGCDIMIIDEGSQVG
ncbi:hypothetical protein BC937DRAFT_93240 [Endogone sp. FLAS-F59071]|nr:hypothetical protein BC937DRAFT_93240 [Endogone sp. FLAS-F59071]|eukprot:RUS14846.1 hypothetical protein BC937DRAFT_93240 [Endogone sp. FLAS-F59071]